MLCVNIQIEATKQQFLSKIKKKLKKSETQGFHKKKNEIHKKKTEIRLIVSFLSKEGKRKQMKQMKGNLKRKEGNEEKKNFFQITNGE